jgi:hypothetical protein
VVSASGLQVGRWSWWAPTMDGGYVAPGLRLSGLVGVCDRRHWSLGPRNVGRWSWVFEVLLPVCRWWSSVVRSRRSGSSCSPPSCPVVVMLFFLFGLVVESLVRWYPVGPWWFIVSSQSCQSLYYPLFYLNAKRAMHDLEKKEFLTNIPRERPPWDHRAELGVAGADDPPL